MTSCRSKLSLIICYLIGITVYSFDPVMQSFPSIFIDDFMRTFSTTSVGVGMIAASYFYSYNLMQIPAGILCDKLGIKRILIFSSIICAIALTLFSHAHTLQSAICCRILMGLGASSAAVIMILICKEHFNIVLLPVLIGIAQFACNIGALSGQYPLTFLSATIGWRQTILSLSIIPILLLIITFIFPDIITSQNNKIKNMTASKSFKKYWQENIKVFSNKRNWHIALYAMLLWTPFYTFASLWGIPFLREKLGLNVTEASKLLAIAWVGSGIGSILIGILSSYLRKRKICIMLSAAMGIILFPFLILFDIHNITILSCILFLFGIASAGQALSFVLIDDNNKNSLLGTASGFNNIIIMIGPMLIDPIVGSLLKFNWNGTLHDGIPFYSIANFQQAFIVVPILFFAAFIVSFFYKEIPNISNELSMIQKITPGSMPAHIY